MHGVVYSFTKLNLGITSSFDHGTDHFKNEARQLTQQPNTISSIRVHRITRLCAMVAYRFT